MGLSKSFANNLTTSQACGDVWPVHRGHGRAKLKSSKTCQHIAIILNAAPTQRCPCDLTGGVLPQQLFLFILCHVIASLAFAHITGFENSQWNVSVAWLSHSILT